MNHCLIPMAFPALSSCFLRFIILTGVAVFSGGLCPTSRSATAETVAAATITPGTPQLNLITPRGVQRGAEYTLQFHGARLAKAEEVFLYDSEGKITVTSVKPVDASRVEVVIKVEADCRIGEHLAQLRTRDGISEFRSFYIGALPEMEEKEPNTIFDQAQEISLGTTINGIVTNEDIDYFKFTGKKGERVSVEVEGIRLGFLFDPAISILNEQRFEIGVSDDTPLAQQDPWLSVLLPEDGIYYVAIREASFRGNPQSRYRMHVGRFSRPTAVIPTGGKPGEKLKLRFVEQLGGAGTGVNFVEKELTLPVAEGARPGILFEDEQGVSPSPIPFQLSNLENIVEAEGNNDFPETPIIDLTTLTQGVAISGIVDDKGAVDFYRFKAKQNQVFLIKCDARKFGSSLDPVINIYNQNKQGIAGNDDGAGLDSLIRFQVPADGDYFITVRDHLSRKNAGFVYRVEIVPTAPQLQIGIQRNDRYSQNRQTISVPQGNRFAVLVNAERSEFGGELKLLEDSLPAGVTMKSVPMAAGLNLMPVVFEATADAPIGGKLVDFRAQHVDPATKIEGGFRNFSDFVLGEPNNRVYYGSTVKHLAMGVIEPLPFRLELVQPKAPLVKNGLINIKVIAHRNQGFAQPIQIYFPFLSPGVGTTVQQTIPTEQSEVVYTLNANNGAQVGKWPMYVIGSSEVDGPAWASTQLAELTIDEPLLKTNFDRASVILGQPTKLYCKIEHLKPFEGEATAEIIAVPPNVTVQTPLKFNKDTAELSFEVQTTDASPVGKHGLYCQVTIMQDGEPVIFRTGDIQLQINKPVPPKETKTTQPNP